jgi:hydrogenase nickel incorporation protein HypA/HybF
MHEWALAEAVLQSVQDQMKNRELSNVRSVRLLFGELQKIDPEVFLFGLRALCGDLSLDPEVFHIETESASFLCNRCGREWQLREARDIDEDQREAIHFLPESAHSYLRCPRCGSPDFRVEKGRGVVIESIEYVNGT